MRKLFTLLVVFIFTVYYSLLTVQAQAPQKMNYQAVIRDASGLLVTNHGVGMQISILKGIGLVPVYVETQAATTNANGLVTIVIGDGTVVLGSLAAIDWSTDSYSIKTETDPTSAGGTSYSITGVSKLLSVPYALNAKTAENAFSGNYNDLTNRPTLFNGQYGSLSGSPIFATVATSGNYTDLSGKPALWDSTWASIKNKPNFFNGQYSSLSGAPTNISTFTNDAGYLTSYTEVDPKIGSNTSGYSPKWNGSAFVTGAIFQDTTGNVGIGTITPSKKLHLVETVTNNDILLLQNKAGGMNNSAILAFKTCGGTGNTDAIMGRIKVIDQYNWNGSMSFEVKSNSSDNPTTVEMMRITNIGNVGIGTTTPDYKLDVSGDINTTGAFKINGTPLATVASSGSYSDLINKPILFDGQYSNLSGAPTNISNFTNDAGYLTSYTEVDPKIGSNTSGYSPKWNGSALVTGAIFQDASGRIGIGKTSPQTTLDITSTNTTDAVIRLKNFNDPIGAVIINTYNAVQFGMFNPSSSALNQLPAGSGRSFFGFDPTGKVGSLTNYYLINVYRNLLDDGSGNAFFTGNVGLGNSTPAYKLDVSGDINTTGAFKINGTALATVASSGSYTDLTNKPTVDGSETKVTAGANISVTGTGTSASPYVINATAHYIGESYGGGIVFYVYDNGQHGLIAATADLSTGMQWYNGTSTTTNAVRDGIGAGKLNTERIIANQSTGNYAAQLCSNYQGGNFGDWYLPSKYELNLMYLQRSVVGGFTSANYWCSTEYNATYSYYQNFGSQGYQTYTTKDYSSFYIRAIRAF